MGTSDRPDKAPEPPRDVLAAIERMQAERESLARQRQLALDAAHMGWWHYDTATRIATYDQRYREIFGVSGSESPIEQMLALLDPEDLPRVRAAVEAALDPRDPRPYSTEYRIHRPDGTLCWVEAHGIATFEGEGADRHAISLVGTVADITARKRVDDEAQRLLAVVQGEKDRLAALIDSMTDEVWFADSDRKFTLANASAVREFAMGGGAQPGESVKVDVQAFAESLEVLRADGTPRPVDEAPALRALHGETVRNVHEIIRTPATRELRHRQVSAAPVRDAGERIIGSVTVVRDITDLTRAEEAMRASEERYRRLFENMAEGFFLAELILDDRGRPYDYRYLDANKAFESLTGLKREQTVGRTVREVLPEVEEVWIETYGRVALTGEPARIENYAAPLGRSYSTTAYCPRPGQFACLFRDVTERVRAEQRLEDANERLRDADRRKNEFLAVLSHELRNPLAPITNSLYILDRSVPGGDQARRAQSVIARQVAQLSRLVDDLLDVTRITRNKIQLQRQRLELNDLVRHTLEDHRSAFEAAGVELEFEPAPDPVFADGDWNRLAQVIGNLLQNAAKFTSQGGRTTVSLRCDPGASRALLRVVDTGVGMAPETLAGLFEPFMQADHSLDRSKGGLGLGLALVKGLVELHGGDILAHSAGLGRGAEFTVSLPLDLTGSGEAKPVGGVGRHGGRRVLVIEDNLDAADSLRVLLEFTGHQAEAAYNGPDGIAKAASFRPEVVLCDIGLPGMDGYEVARAFRADPVLADTYLIALSGYALPEDLQRAQEAGFDRHIAKPPQLDALQELLATLPGGRRR